MEMGVTGETGLKRPTTDPVLGGAHAPHPHTGDSHHAPPPHRLHGGPSSSTPPTHRVHSPRGVPQGLCSPCLLPTHPCGWEQGTRGCGALWAGAERNPRSRLVTRGKRPGSEFRAVNAAGGFRS